MNPNMTLRTILSRPFSFLFLQWINLRVILWKVIKIAVTYFIHLTFQTVYPHIVHFRYASACNLSDPTINGNLRSPLRWKRCSLRCPFNLYRTVKKSQKCQNKVGLPDTNLWGDYQLLVNCLVWYRYKPIRSGYLATAGIPAEPKSRLSVRLVRSIYKSPTE